MPKTVPNLLKIIDFGLISSFTDENGNHLSQQFENRFSGNQYFASSDQMKMLTTSRKDDLVSLCYMLVYLIDRELIFLNEQTKFIDILNKKLNLLPSELCCSEKSQPIKDFVSEIFKLGFYEKPDYAKLKFLLVKQLLEYDQTPSDDIFNFT